LTSELFFLFREVEQLKRKIAQLEAVLISLRPQIDLSLLPRTNDQAKTMASALQDTSSSHPLNPQISLAHQNLVLGTDDHRRNHEEIQHDSQDDEDEDEEEEEEDEEDEEQDEDFRSMLKSMGECQLGSYQFLVQDKDPFSSHTPQKTHSLEDPDTNPDLDDQSASFIEQYRSNYLSRILTKDWPDDDLASKLISTYFEAVHPYPPVVHELEFRKDYQAGLAKRNTEFRSLCYAIFAAASPYLDDPRVLYTSHSDGLHPRQSAGAIFAHASIIGATKFQTVNLVGLQSLAIISYYMLAMSNPRHTFALVVEFLRTGLWIRLSRTRFLFPWMFGVSN
jgi:hypothetical protein